MKIDWMFRKYVAPRHDTPPATADKADTAAARKAAKAAAPAPAPVDWQPRLQAALGDDEALLALAREALPIEARLAAVEALAGEAALRQAEREFRNRDRRVHRVAKQRYQALVTQRETREQAKCLIAAAQALVGQEQLPLNRLVDLDHAWQALDATALEEALCSDFATLLAALGAHSRDAADRALRLKRWTAEAKTALAAWQASCKAAAEGTQTRQELAAAAAAVHAQLDAAPGADSATLCETLRASLRHAAPLDERLALLDELAQAASAPRARTPTPAPEMPAAPPDARAADAPAAAPAEPPPETPAGAPSATTPSAGVEATAEVAADAKIEVATEALAEAPTEIPDETPADAGVEAPTPAPPAAPRDAGQRWQALAPLEDAALAAALERRFEAWQQGREAERQARRTQRREQAKDEQRAVRSERSKTLAAALDLAEAALAAGHLIDTHKQLVDIDELLHGGASAGELRTRIDALQAQYAQLKGWQHWSGGVARDELVLQAEALAAASAGAGLPGGIKLSLKQQAETIAEMRERWRELDRLGGATSRALWQRFDSALKTAYEPVAVQVAAQRAAREINLQARRDLIAALDGVALPEPGEGQATPPDWKALAVALDHFQAEWRKLGPVEHTVPHKAREGLLERMRQAMQRIEAPLGEARRSAQAAREELIAQARALGEEAAHKTLGRDLVDRVRALQGQWQQQAKALPLARGAENALWAEFKGTIDAIFSARDAEFNAREAEFQAHGAERGKLIERLEALSADTPVAEFRRTLAEVDTLWQRAGPAPRHDAAALDQRFRQARDTAQQWLAGSAQRAWHATCDTLAAKLALCEQAPPDDAAKAALAERWAALPALPASWEQALAPRAGLAPAPRGPAVVKTASDELLLKLEDDLQIDSPPACQQARRDLKLHALKAALESRSAAHAPLEPDAMLCALLARAELDTLQRERLGAILGALRRHGPGGPRRS